MKTNSYLLLTILLLTFSVNSKAQLISTFAGDMAGAGYTGDGGPAISAQLNHAKSMALDDTGNIYIADANNNCIRKVDLAGNISTFSGVVSPGFSGDGLPASFAQYDHPDYIVIDASNNMYICDADNERIRKISNTGIVSTIVGDGNPGYIGDGGAATAAEINLPSGIAIDGLGNLYIADASNNVIRKVNSSGIISTIAGNGSSGSYTGEGGPATAATLAFPYGIAADGAGNVYVGLYYESRICKIDPTGTITTYAGVGGGSGFGISGDGGPATAATFDSPWGISLDHAGNLYIADNANNRIRKVNMSGIVNTVAGNGSYGYTGDFGPATGARLAAPVGQVIGPDGSIYIADFGNSVVRKVNGSLTHPPTFISGHAQAFTMCENAPAMSLNSYLAIADADAGQLETWSVALAPLHGTLVAAYSTTSTGGTLTPTGLSYTPASGYAGLDSFKVRISDGTASDTTTIVVNDSACSNHPPSFIGGHTQSSSVCKNASDADINPLLAVSDVDPGQTETWSVVTAPSHGTLVAAYTTTSTGSVISTTGLSYTPTTGYTGTDLFRVRVNDGNASDTTTVNVTVSVCPTSVAIVSNADNGITIYPNPNPGTFTFNLSSATEEDVQITVTNVVGGKVTEITATTNKPTAIQLKEPAGLYFLNAVTAHGKWSTKISVAP